MALTDEDKEQIRRMIQVSTEETITETFRLLGINTQDLEHIREFRENSAWVRRYRNAAERVGSQVIVTITMVLSGGIITAIWAYLQKR